ncbi:MAG TPA: mechanosensitive ion channel family protein, partial [Acidobacteriota bacterium]|nr:mechanosensitive ion channel family protein [Acidobacteriota bacterium]
MSLTEILNGTFYGNSYYSWLVALAVTIFLAFFLRLIRNRVINRLRRLSQRTENLVDDSIVDVLSRTRFLPILVVSIYFGSEFLQLGRIEEWIGRLTVIAVLFQIAFWGDALLSVLIERYTRIAVEEESSRVASRTALNFLSRLLLWSLVLLVALDNVGINVTALIASLGVGGIAVALAAQNILGDLFSSLSIMFDKPFVVGDFIIVGEELGTVEKIGLKTTRVRSLHGEQLIFSNTDLLNSRIRNFKRMYQRRIVFSIGITYETPYEKLKEVASMLREIVQAHDLVRFDRAHFKGFGDSS